MHLHGFLSSLGKDFGGPVFAFAGKNEQSPEKVLRIVGVVIFPTFHVSFLGYQP
jgi:hypothetical protein